ncbi:SUMF1/EgtB/PvdO family nonheme iron enzyme [Pseudomonas sp. P9_2]|uniref:formylglycine-generating enzyme family protein n=1 Tax=Pseudomonas sp. P9_2 TaxID=3043447 RepID=UPI002A366596|nr:SUMF1/EgtB/PvdO family nonheme iron enzyme [Pseudomonas sp. P9_2]WPN51991.1 SUMF1/EgtB/PvdO family nonheme iron enzyme [Pseudomonas sp. P9_2]
MNSKKYTKGLFLVVILAGCERTDKVVNVSEVKAPSQELKWFVERVRQSLVFVEGGEFLMGDYGREYGPEKMSYDVDKDSKPVHSVKLSGYSMGEFKVTNLEYQYYLKINGLQLRQVHQAFQKKWEDISSIPNTPAHMDWYEAEQYCAWLAKITALPFALPTEAQWEYAARSRGQFLMVATDDGTYKMTNDPVTRDWESGPRGINISSSWDREAFAKAKGWKTDTFTPLPVDMFPPNPLGMYSMSDNGYEWVKDWYDPEYYKNSPVNDPQGPEKPVFKDYFGRDTKVVRGQDFANPAWGGGVNVHRTAAEPHGYRNKEEIAFLTTKTARCAVNSATPIK